MGDEVITRFLAKLDSLHDFCGARNEHIMKDDIVDIVGAKTEANLVKPYVVDNNGSLYRLIDALAHYGAYKFPTFEHATLELAKQLRKNHVLCEASFSISDNKNKSAFVKQLNDVRAEHVAPDYIVDTSTIPSETLCGAKGAESSILVTGATVFDKGGKEIAPACRVTSISDSKTTTLLRSNGELLEYDRISVQGNGSAVDPYVMKLNNDITVTPEAIQSRKFGVKSYARLMNSIIDQTTDKRELKTLEIFGIHLNGKMKPEHVNGLVRRLMDYKRSGDWLQIASYHTFNKTQVIGAQTGGVHRKPPKQSAADKRAERLHQVKATDMKVKADALNVRTLNPIFLTIDRPAVARAIMTEVPTLFSTVIDGQYRCTYYGTKFTPEVRARILRERERIVKFNAWLQAKRWEVHSNMVLAKAQMIREAVTALIGRFQSKFAQYAANPSLVEAPTVEYLRATPFTYNAFYMDHMLDMTMRLMLMVRWVEKLYNGDISAYTDLISPTNTPTDIEYGDMHRKNNEMLLAWGVTNAHMMACVNAEELVKDMYLASKLLTEIGPDGINTSGRAFFKDIPNESWVISMICKHTFNSMDQLSDCVDRYGRVPMLKWYQNLFVETSAVQNAIAKERYELYSTIHTNLHNNLKYYTRLMMEDMSDNGKIIYGRMETILSNITGGKVYQRKVVKAVRKQQGGMDPQTLSRTRTSASNAPLPAPRPASLHGQQPVSSRPRSAAVAPSQSERVNTRAVSRRTANANVAQQLATVQEEARSKPIQIEGMVDMIVDNLYALCLAHQALYIPLLFANIPLPPRPNEQDRKVRRARWASIQVYPRVYEGADGHVTTMADLPTYSLKVERAKLPSSPWMKCVPVHTFDFTDVAAMAAVRYVSKGVACIDLLKYVLYKTQMHTGSRAL